MIYAEALWSLQGLETASGLVQTASGIKQLFTNQTQDLDRNSMSATQRQCTIAFDNGEYLEEHIKTFKFSSLM